MTSSREKIMRKRTWSLNIKRKIIFFFANATAQSYLQWKNSLREVYRSMIFVKCVRKGQKV